MTVTFVAQGGGMIPQRLATFISYSRRNFVAAAIRGSIVGAVVSILLPILFLFFWIFVQAPGLFFGFLLYAALCALIGAAWGCLRVADRHSRAFPLFIIQYALFGALIANVAVNLFSVVSSGRIPHGLLVETKEPPAPLELDDETPAPAPDQQPSDKTNDETPTTAPDQQPSDKTNDETPSVAPDERPHFALLVYEMYEQMFLQSNSWFSRLFMRFNELAICMGALFGALLRTLMYFRSRNAKNAVV
jgi:hypothetical protein